MRKIKTIDISIHAPPRGATAEPAANVVRTFYFNSRPSARGDKMKGMRFSMPMNFNSRPSARGDQGNVLGIICDRISIHAPPRGATRKSGGLESVYNISIHAPPRGATEVVALLVAEVLISIHAPPRGATSGEKKLSMLSRFQFTPLREGRRACRFLVFCGFPFQFTPLREGRHARDAGHGKAADFNSRPSARGDAQWLHQRHRAVEFQFTPLREGRRQKICNFCKSFVQPLQISMA